MKSYVMLGAFAILAAYTGLAAAPIQADDKDHKEHGAMFEQCAKVCADCQVACDKNFHHCFMLVEAGKVLGVDMVKLAAEANAAAEA